MEANEPELESVARESMRRTSFFLGLGLAALVEDGEFRVSKMLEKSLGSLLSFLGALLVDPPSPLRDGLRDKVREAEA